MPTAPNTAHWRQQPLIPADYNDLATLVNVARKVRRKTVDFDWYFTRLDLLSLRRAAYEWGSPVRGRYFKNHTDPQLRDFFTPGLRVPAAIPNDSPIRLFLSSDVPIAGLPIEIIE